MSTPALVKAADLKRMADVAKLKGVTVWIEVNGKKVGVSPDIPANHSQTKDSLPDDFAF